MTDYLQIDHWLGQAIAILRADTGVQDLGLILVERADLMYYPTESYLAEHLPAALVGMRDSIEIEVIDVSAEQQDVHYPLRCVVYYEFAQSADVMGDKSTAIGALHGAFRAVQSAAASWPVPTVSGVSYQFLSAIPLRIELVPPEEARIRAIRGSDYLWASAFTLELAVRIGT